LKNLKTNLKMHPPQGAATANNKERRHAKQAAAAAVAFEEINEDCFPYSPLFVCTWCPEFKEQREDLLVLSTTTHLSVQRGPCVDSATMVGVTNSTNYVTGYERRSYQLTGILHKAEPAQGCTIGFSTVTDSGKPILVCTKDSIHVPGATKNLLALAQLLNIKMPVGDKVTLIFKNNLW
jgi:hypothetical protein